MFTEVVEEFNPEETILQYILFVGNLIEKALLTEKDSPLLMHCVLNFYELVSTTSWVIVLFCFWKQGNMPG